MDISIFTHSLIIIWAVVGLFHAYDEKKHDLFGYMGEWFHFRHDNKKLIKLLLGPVAFLGILLPIISIYFYDFSFGLTWLVVATISDAVFTHIIPLVSTSKVVPGTKWTGVIYLLLAPLGAFLVTSPHLIGGLIGFIWFAPFVLLCKAIAFIENRTKSIQQ